MVQALTDPVIGNDIFLTRITRVEVTAAVTRRGLPSGVSVTATLSQFRHDLAHQYNTLEIVPALLVEAERLAERHGLRGYDAAQMAASTTLHQARLAAGLGSLTLISADGELNTAAQTEGLAVDDPNSHP